MSGPNAAAWRGSARGADRDTLEALIMKIARGDSVSLGAFYDATVRWAYGLALRILGDSGAAEEVSLDAYMQVWRQAGSYSPGRGSPLSWLLTIARSRAIDRLRSGAMRRSLERSFGEGFDAAGLAGSDPFLASSETERGRILRSAMSSLPAAERRVIELAFFSGLTHTEIAEKFREPLGTVKTRIRRGMLKLRNLLRPLEEA